MYYDIYQLLCNGLDTRGVFLDISKAFDKVWHNCLHYKLMQNGVSGNLLNVVNDFLCQRKQNVFLRYSLCHRLMLKQWSPRDVFLDHYFLIYINDLSDGLTSN